MDIEIKPNDTLDMECVFISLEALTVAIEEEEHNLIHKERERRIQYFLQAYATLHKYALDTWGLFDDAYPFIERYASNHGYTLVNPTETDANDDPTE